MNLGTLITGVVLSALLATAASAQSLVTVKPADTGAALVNPDMGWVAYFYSNVPANYGSHLEPSDTADYFPGLSTVGSPIPDYKSRTVGRSPA